MRFLVNKNVHWSTSVKDILMSKAAEANLKILFLAEEENPPSCYVILSTLDLYLQQQDQELYTEPWQTARAYKVLTECLQVLMKCSQAKVLVMLPMAVAKRGQMDLAASIGLSAVASIVMDEDVGQFIVKDRIRFFSAINYVLNMTDNRDELMNKYFTQKQGGFQMLQTGCSEIGFSISNMICKWESKESPEDAYPGLTPFQGGNLSDYSSLIYPYRPAAPLEEAVEQYEYQNYPTQKLPQPQITPVNPMFTLGAGAPAQTRPHPGYRGRPARKGTSGHPGTKNVGQGKQPRYQGQQRPGNRHSPWADHS